MNTPTAAHDVGDPGEEERDGAGGVVDPIVR